MVETALEGRWLLEDGEGNTTFAVISASLDVTFVEDPDTSMRIVMRESTDGCPGSFVMVSDDGEELCRGKLLETSEGQILELESDESTETWRKIKPDAPKIVSRKKGALPRIFTKEGQQGSNQPEVEG
eukprot:Skav203933  [mRNA]  locus=scaffold228:560705:561088:- [translate_table: standard]